MHVQMKKLLGADTPIARRIIVKVLRKSLKAPYVATRSSQHIVIFFFESNGNGAKCMYEC